MVAIDATPVAVEVAGKAVLMVGKVVTIEDGGSVLITMGGG